MKLLELLDDFVVSRITFPLINYLYNRTNILGKYRELIKSERYSEGLLKEIQLRKIMRVVKYANNWCPFYTNRFKQIGLVPQDIRTLEDLKRIPPLSRQEVIEHHREMVDIRCQSSITIAERSKRGLGEPAPLAKFRKHKLIMNTSTGSTGIPTTFYQDGSMAALALAHELRLKAWYGLEPVAREARLARIATEYMPSSKILWLRKRLWRQLILPGMFLSDEDYAICLLKIKEFRPKILFGITSALTGLADYIRHARESLCAYRPNLVVSWAAPLYEHEKANLEEVFSAPVTNIFSTREVGHIAALCPEGSLHINEEHFIVENEGDAKIGSDGGPGELLVTALYEAPMPFIRYRIGDLGEVAQSDCACGRDLQVLRQLLGRSGEVFITKSGRMIAPNFWCRLFMVGGQSRSVERFQIILREKDCICLRIVRKDNYTTQTEVGLRQSLEKVFQGNMRFVFEYVPRINPHPSGKYQMVINKITEP